jgi:hypothetical protein
MAKASNTGPREQRLIKAAKAALRERRLHADRMSIDAGMDRFQPPTQSHGKPPSIGARGSKPTPKKKVLRKKVLRKKVASSRVRQSQRERGKLKLKQRRAEGRAR